MKTLIIGLGNIGTLHGWALSQAGADITHAVRKGSKDKYKDGIMLDVLDLRGESTKNYRSIYEPRLTDYVSPADGYELVLVATNHIQSVEAARQYRDLAPAASFLMFTANWNGIDEFDKILTRPRYLWGFSVSTGARGDDGTLYINMQKTYRIGELDGSHTSRLERITALFETAGMHPDIKPNIIEWQWVHHAINAGLLGAALFKGGLPAPDEGPETWLLMVLAVKDALAVLDKRGVNISAYADIKPFLNSNNNEAAENLRRTWTSMPHYQRIREHSHFLTNPQEMRQFYLDVLNSGEQLGVPMPTLESFKSNICGTS